ncbi:hypothetical protein HYX14_04150 [Candidatus Woesearchaeota archaeon]|nr:hypothetical protein [Candidatus Woesearchaeota archaeon]
MNYLVQSFTDALKALRNYKVFFGLLVVFQLIFFVALGYIFLHFQLKMIENYQQIATPLEGIDSTTQPDAELMKTIGAMYGHYQQLLQDLRSLVLWFGVIFLVHGGIWVAQHQLLEQQVRHSSWKEMMIKILQQWLRMLVSSLVLLGPILAISYFMLRSMIFRQADIDAVTGTAKILGAVVLVMYYFLLVAFSLLDVEWRHFPLRFFKVAIQRIHKTIFPILIGLALVSLSLWLLYLSLIGEWPFGLILGATLVWVAVLVFSRLFLISTVKRL